MTEHTLPFLPKCPEMGSGGRNPGLKTSGDAELKLPVPWVMGLP